MPTAEPLDVCEAGLKNLAESTALHAELLSPRFARLRLHPTPDDLEEVRRLLRLVEECHHGALDLVYTIRDVLDEVEQAAPARVA